ncbi:MAG: YggT family protein [Pseudomonadales bacterium]|jgi:YggT family protein|nr:YggT family protein [Pseudomonadales bacterium]
MSGSLGQLISLLVTSLGSLYISIVLLRFLLQAAHADFYNPVSQAIVKLSAAPVRLFRRVIPSWGRLDLGTLVLALVLNSGATALLAFAAGFQLPNFGLILSWSALGLTAFILNIYFYAVLISVITSFIAPFSAHPAILVVHQLIEPLYRLIHRVIPPMGGLDFSPLFIFLGIRALEIVVIIPLAIKLQIIPQLVLGI